MGLTIIGVALGAIIAIVITITIENLRKPKLELRIAPPVDKEYRDEERPAKNVRFLGIFLVNRPLPRWARWMSRNAALQCHGTITFHHLDGQNVFGRAMPIRWSGSTEPLPIHVVFNDVQVFIADPARFNLISKIDVYPEEACRLDVAARFDFEDECYGWNNENYLSDPVWRNPRWKLPTNRYLIEINVVSSGEKCTGIFRLINDVFQSDFRLEDAMPHDTIRA
jgi:hypothetical protein